MAIPVRLFRFTQFTVPPEGFQTKEQVSLFTGRGDKATTEISPDDSDPVPNMMGFRVMHEMLVNQEGRTSVDRFDHYIRSMYFRCYASPSDGRLYSVGAQSRVARGAFERLMKSDVTEGLRIRVSPVKLNLRNAEDVIEKKGSITGGWFGNLRIENVHSASFFGQDVTQSLEWEKYGELGELSSLHVSLRMPDGTEEQAWLTSECSIVFMGNDIDTTTVLQMCSQVFDAVEDSMTAGTMRPR
jgi:hypothetical protein